MNLGADPMQGERDEAHAALGVEAAHRFHEAHVALLDQVALGQAVAEVVAAHADHEPQMAHHELACGFNVLHVLPAQAELVLLLGGQERVAVDRGDVLVDGAERTRNREIERCGGMRHSCSPFRKRSVGLRTARRGQP